MYKIVKKEMNIKETLNKTFIEIFLLFYLENLFKKDKN